MLPARLIAFYLPQFHPIPENDSWWGKGFTEWTNVARARPRFEGHYQPRLPADLGFYDLRLPEVRRAQADLARAAGIHGFCYYHYWFDGKLLLERPLDELLRSGEPDFPFCICWANEDWRRNWDGRSGEVLIAQTYGEQDDRRHIAWLANAFRDRRYIRVGGKPLLIVYRPLDLPAPARTAELWRREAARLGVGDLFLCGMEFAGRPFDAKRSGFDASIEFQPHGTFAAAPRFAGIDEVYEYDAVVEFLLNRPASYENRFPCLFPSWDNSARRQYNRATIVTNSTPETYERWLTTLTRRLSNRPQDERIIFVNAWNEWGEGAYLEPDLRYGRAYLAATRRAMGLPEEEPAAQPSGVPPASPDGAGAAPSVQMTPAEEVRTLQAALEDSRHELEWMRRSLDGYLATANSPSWRLLTALNKSVDAVAPSGTRRRRAIQRLLRILAP